MKDELRELNEDHSGTRQSHPTQGGKIDGDVA
jgi:hypothetical protein